MESLILKKKSMKTLVLKTKGVATGNFPKSGKHSIKVLKGTDINKTIKLNIRCTNPRTLELQGCKAIINGVEQNTVSIVGGFAFVTFDLKVYDEVAYMYLPSDAVWAFYQDWLSVTSASPKIDYSITFRNLNSIKEMFSNAVNFNQPFNVVSDYLTDAQAFLANAVQFNSKLNIPTKSIAVFSAFFANTNFNQDISDWNVSAGISFNSMFLNNTVFNQDISGWNMANATTMASMFKNATGFNKDISNWNFNKEVDLDLFMDGKSSADYSASFYTNLLLKLNSIDWTGRVKAKKLSMGTIKHTAEGSSARASLISKGWTITDGGSV